MVASESVTECVLDGTRAADVDAALALSDAAGWNQSADDWRLFTQHGRVRGRRNARGELVATAATLPYGAQGWVSMVLVRADWRRRGLATELLGACVRELRDAGITPLLDATPAGEPVYRRLGFEAGLRFERWQGAVTGDAAMKHDAVRDAGAADVPAIVALDAAANRVTRPFLLPAFLSRPQSRAFVRRDGSGFVLARRGRRASQIGPLVAADAHSAIELLEAALHRVGGAVFLDVACAHTAVIEYLGSLGFTRQRPFVRMALGPAAALQGDGAQVVFAGPEFG